MSCWDMAVKDKYVAPCSISKNGKWYLVGLLGFWNFYHTFMFVALFIKQSLWRQSSFDKVLKDTAGMPCLPTDMTNICVDTSGPNRGRTIDSNPSGNPTR